MAVGPSAPPMMPMAAATFASKPNTPMAIRKAAKMPNWAAAPRSRDLGFASRGPKSVMAPTPIKMSEG